LGYEYPFVLKVVQRGGNWCAWCPWHRFCRGCALPCSAKEFEFGASYLAIDWDQTALHLRYLANQEKVLTFNIKEIRNCGSDILHFDENVYFAIKTIRCSEMLSGKLSVFFRLVVSLVFNIDMT
jgi:hypothetical protein